jgi:hypothetical protein
VCSVEWKGGYEWKVLSDAVAEKFRAISSRRSTTTKNSKIPQLWYLVSGLRFEPRTSPIRVSISGEEGKRNVRKNLRGFVTPFRRIQQPNSNADIDWIYVECLFLNKEWGKKKIHWLYDSTKINQNVDWVRDQTNKGSKHVCVNSRMWQSGRANSHPI